MYKLPKGTKIVPHIIGNKSIYKGKEKVGSYIYSTEEDALYKVIMGSSFIRGFSFPVKRLKCMGSFRNGFLRE